MSRDSSISIETGYGLEAGVGFPAEARYFSLHHSIQRGSDVYPASYPIGAGGTSSGGVQAWARS
jgi:hypothetical protein